MKFTFRDILQKIGEKGTEAYRQSLIDNDRVATGKTKNSIRYEISGDNVLKIYAASHIMDLEHGKTASQIQAEGANLEQQISEWMSARGIFKGATAAIMRSLVKNGWNTTRKNRTGQNGGTVGIITNVTKNIEEDVVEEISTIASEQIRKNIKDELSNFK